MRTNRTAGQYSRQLSYFNELWRRRRGATEWGALPTGARNRAARPGLPLLAFSVCCIILNTEVRGQRSEASGLSPQMATWISQVCSREPGPAFFQCQSRQAAAARSTRRPDLSALSVDDRRRVAFACSEVARQGPAIFWPCLEQKANQLATLSPAQPLPSGGQMPSQWDPAIPDLTARRPSPYLTGPAPAFGQPTK
jgi:hypothetical protein